MFIRELALVHALLAGCIDEPVRIVPPSGGPPADTLSQLGLFAGDPSAQQPAVDVVAYDVIAPLWSDGASKHRFVLAATPLGGTDDHWQIPDGTYLVKTFYFGTRLVETRIIAFHDGGADLATYVWNDDQTDAIASGGNLDIDVAWLDADGAAHAQTHHVPGTSQCNSCHRGGALGLRTPQGLDAIVAAQLIDNIPPNIAPFVDPYGDAPLVDRATGYLDVNCAHCHSPGGEAADTHADWRRAHVLDNICRSARHSVDGHDLIIAPGAPDDSVLLARMRSHDAFVHMPRGPSHIIDEPAVDMLAAWIASMAAECP